MTADKIKQRITLTVSHFIFEFEKISCGIDPISYNRFDVWCGDKFEIFSSIDDVMNVPFFNGRALRDIAKEITIIEQ